jgi:hypothetical protein
MSVIAPDVTADALGLPWQLVLQPPSGSVELGSGSEYLIDSISGLGPPGIKVTELELPEQHGGVSHGLWHTARTVTVTGRVRVDTPDLLYTAVQALSRALAAQPAYPVSLRWRGGRTMQALMRPAGPPDLGVSTGLWRAGLCPFQLQLQADDPRWYALEEASGTIDPAEAGGGLDYPLDYPLDYGAGAEGTLLILVNEGTAPTPLAATFTGPPAGSVTQLVLHNQTTSELLTLDFTLEPGHTLAVDTGAKTITLDATASRYAAKSPDSPWLQLAPGANVLAYRAQGSSGSQAAVTARSAWW